MSTRSAHDPAKPRSHARRLAVPAAVAVGLMFAAQWPDRFDVFPWTSARADAPAAAPRKVVPRVVDFAKLAKQKAEARGLLESARKAAAAGNLDAARRLAGQAATIPVEWNLGEATPKKFLDELDADPSRFFLPTVDDVARPDSNAMDHGSRRPVMSSETRLRVPASNRDVIELAFPDDQVSDEDVSEDMSLPDQTHGLKLSQPAKPRSANADSRVNRRMTPIPSLDDLSGTMATDENARLESAHEMYQAPKFPPAGSSSFAKSNRDANDQLAAASHRDVLPADESMFARPMICAEAAKPAAARTDADVRTKEAVPPAMFPSPEKLIHEIRIVDRPSSVVQADANSASTTQFLMNVNSLMMVGLFGTLLLLILVAVSVLRKFGPNPQFTFKVEVSNPIAAAATAAAISAPLAPLASLPTIVPMPFVAPRTAPTAPVIALQRVAELDCEVPHEDAMLRQVLEDNLQLRNQLDESRVAA